ncbi:MAG: hypothetical protein NTY66_01245 [Candidatus Vogelbacteria bacterium]|nr:hypothetical protein [Candidatus Vogelbacteria bacterium]
MLKISPLREKITRKLLGLTYRLDNSGDAVFTQNGEEEFMEQLGSNYSGPITVFDIGANMGGYTDILLRKRPNPGFDQFHLFEPQKTVLATS